MEACPSLVFFFFWGGGGCTIGSRGGYLRAQSQGVIEEVDVGSERGGAGSLKVSVVEGLANGVGDESAPVFGMVPK